MSYHNARSSLLALSIFLVVSITKGQALSVVPASSTFKLINEADFGEYSVEYGGNYRAINIFTSPFQLCFYNTTPYAYTLALRMGGIPTESVLRWVWEANRGNPVGDNASLTFGTDGNLVLADADGRIAWQTHTANKGVVGFKLLPNGNMVLHNVKGNFIWQSFDYPTDTLLVGQSLRVVGPVKLISRVSTQVNSNGPYSLVLGPSELSMYYKSPNYPSPLVYSSIVGLFGNSFKQVTLDCSPETKDAFAYDITIAYQSVDGSNNSTVELARPKYNSTLSFLRLEIDGNLRVYTYSNKVDWGPWEATFTFFTKDLVELESPYTISDTDCQLPGKCGEFGLCEDGQCVACPTPKGLLGWSKSCQQPKPSCGNKYYKLEGVDNFLTKNNNVGDYVIISLNACERKCTKDCKCLGYFYHQENSKCWVLYDLKTLRKVSEGSHIGYIKI